MKMKGYKDEVVDGLQGLVFLNNAFNMNFFQ